MFEFEIVDVVHTSVDVYFGKIVNRACQLLLHLLNVIGVHVTVTEIQPEPRRLVPGHLRDHVCEQRVARDVERHAQEHVGGPLVHIARQFVSVHVKLAHHVTRRQNHLVYVRHVPRVQDEPSAVWVCFDFVDNPLNLVESCRFVRLLRRIRGAPMSPLIPVHGSQLPFGTVVESEFAQVLETSVSVPYLYTLVVQLFGIRRTR